MTREEKLFTMRMVDIAELAEKLGIKVDKKGSKANAVKKILDAEAKNAEKPADKKPAEKKVDKAPKKVEAPAEKPADDDKCADGRTYAEIGKEIAEQAKEKAKDAKKPAEKPAKKPADKKPKAKKSANEAVAKILEFISADIDGRNDCSVGVPASEDMKFRALRVGKKQFCKVMWTKQNVRLYFRCDIADIAPNANSLNYNLPNYTVLDTIDKNIEKSIKKLFDRAIALELDKKNK